MFSSKVLYFIAFCAWLIVLLQHTPARFLTPDLADAAWGFAAGTTIAVVVVWLGKRRTGGV